MDLRRLVIFVVLSFGIMLLWGKYISPHSANQMPNVQTNNNINSTTTNTNSNTNDVTSDVIGDNNIHENTNSGALGINGASNSSTNINSIANAKTILVTTDLLQAKISTLGGTISSLALLNYGSNTNSHEPYLLLNNATNNTFIAQSGLLGANKNVLLPNHNTLYQASSYNYTMKPQDKSLVVSLLYRANGLQVIKNLTFKPHSYVIDVSYQITNNNPSDLNNISAYFRLLRDENTPSGETKFAHTFTGAAYYSNEAKFNKLSFSDFNKNDLNYPNQINNGWVGFIEHYFIASWLLDAYGYSHPCSNDIVCRLNFRLVNNNTLASAGLLVDLPIIKAHSSYHLSMPLFTGPQGYHVLKNAAPELDRSKDYGWVYIFATPLFWLLVKLYDLVLNWGYAIILLTVVVKMVLYPLTRASYISMAKMKSLAPKLEKIRKDNDNDKMALQKAMMELYRSEKVNPLGGCLPMVLQIPVFIGLYWALLSSVELRQASFLWIRDLSQPDPYYILPLVLALTMILQTFLSPAPADPVQAKMMRIMPVAFSVMFFFFPAGLVVYWLVNNVLSILQQWHVNRNITLKHKTRVLLKKDNIKVR